MMMYTIAVNNHHVCYSKEANIRRSVKYRLVSEQSQTTRTFVFQPHRLDDALVKRFGGSKAENK